MYDVNPAFFDNMELDEAMYLLKRHNYIKKREIEEYKKMRAKYERFNIKPENRS